jgi:hypothetical protein
MATGRGPSIISITNSGQTLIYPIRKPPAKAFMLLRIMPAGNFIALRRWSII